MNRCSAITNNAKYTENNVENIFLGDADAGSPHSPGSE